MLSWHDHKAKGAFNDIIANLSIIVITPCSKIKSRVRKHKSTSNFQPEQSNQTTLINFLSLLTWSTLIYDANCTNLLNFETNMTAKSNQIKLKSKSAEKTIGQLTLAINSCIWERSSISSRPIISNWNIIYIYIST